jgi:hypothetical protein
MRLALAMTALALSPSAVAQQHEHEIEFHQAGELLPWCESEARAHFVGKGVTTYQWTSRYYDKGNMLVVEGKIRANGNDVPVVCRVARGARERYAAIEINETP